VVVVAVAVAVAAAALCESYIKPIVMN
jgi:hypothetical protein